MMINTNSLRAVRSFKYNENRNHLNYEIKEFGIAGNETQFDFVLYFY